MGTALVLALVGCKGDAPAKEAPKTAGEPAPIPVAKRDEEPPEPPKPQAHVPKTPADYVGKHVLVPHGAKLRVAPNEEAEFAALELLERTDGAPATRTFDVVGSEGEFIAVRPALEDKRCTDSVPGLASFDIKLWVRPHELAPVLGLRTEVKGPDGDVATLWPGVPVGSNGTEATIDLDGLALTVPLDPGVISTAFEPETLPVVADAAKSLGAGPSMTWGGTAVGDQYLLDGGATAPAALVENAAASGKRVATVWTTCAELTGKVDERRPEVDREVLVAKSAGLYGIKGMTSRDVTTYEVREGADVFWRDGGKAGVVASSYEFSFKPKTHKGKKCFALALMEKGETKRPAPEESQLELCFDEIDITEHPSIHEELASAGILGVLGSSGGGSISALGTFDSALDDEDVWGGLTGTEIGEAYGVGGLGLSGAGGGGTGEGTIGLGTIGTIGGASGSTGSTAKVKQGKTTSSGDLDGDIARRIIRAHRNEIRSCYSKVLADKEGASGSIKLSISVGPTGTVASASTSDDTVGDIASCIEKAAKRWKFPKASGVTIVSTSFTFSSL